MKKLILALLFPLMAQAAPVIFSGNDVKTLKPNIDLNGQSKILSGTVDPTVTATSAPIGSIYLNSSTGVAYRKLDAGSTTNWTNLAISSVAQSSVLGTVKITGCAGQWSTTATSFASFSAQTGCVYTTTGVALAPSTMLPAIKLGNIPPGEILLVYDGIFGDTTTNTTTSFRIFDGSTAGRELPSVNTGTTTGIISTFTSSLSYSTAQSNLTLEIQGITGGAGTANVWGTTGNPGVIKVYYFPTQAQTVINPNLSPAYAGKQWLGASSSQIVVGSSTAPSATRTTLTQANLATYTLLGTAQNDSSQNFQVTATLPPGEYETDFTAFMEAQTAASGTSTACVFEIYDGTTALGSTIFQQNAQAAIGNQDISHVRGYFKLSGTTTKTLFIRAAKTAGDSSATSNCAAYVNSNTSAMLTISPRTQVLPMPVIANSVITSSAGVERIERVSFGGATVDNSNCTASPCTIWRQSGGVASVSRGSSGIYTVTFSPPFSGPPVCTGTGANGANGLTYMRGAAPTSSTWVVQATNVATSSPVDAFADLICQGPK